MAHMDLLLPPHFTHRSFAPLTPAPPALLQLAIIIMNTVSREDVSGESYGDEAATVRTPRTLHDGG